MYNQPIIIEEVVEEDGTPVDDESSGDTGGDTTDTGDDSSGEDFTDVTDEGDSSGGGGGGVGDDSGPAIGGLVLPDDPGDILDIITY